jgi:hypothetical protein
VRPDQDTPPAPLAGGKYVNAKAAAAYLDISTSTLEKQRIRGDGAVFHKLGKRVVYRLEDLDAYADRNRRQSTSEPRTGAQSKAGGGKR